MKKTLILMAAAASVVLTGCTESDLSSDTSLAKESSSAIEFSAKTRDAGTTRAGTAGTITTASLKTGTHAASGFGVMGYQTNADLSIPLSTGQKPGFMYNQKVYWNSTPGLWTYSPVKYWPNGTDKANSANKPSNTAISTNTDRLSFFAYAPWVDVAGSDYSSTAIKTSLKLGGDATGKNAFYADGCSASGITNGIAAFTANTVEADPQVFYYMPNANVGQAVDLLWGLRGSMQYMETDGSNNPNPALTNLGNSYNINLTKQDVPETVNFLFKHALSKIGGNTKSASSTTGQQKCGLKVVVDVDANGSGLDGVDNQNLYLGSDFNNTSTLVTIKSVSVQDGATAWSARATNGIPADPQIRSNLMNSGWFDLATGTWSDVAIVDDKGTEVTTDPSGATYNITAATTGTYTLDPQIAEPTSLAAVLKSDKTGWEGDGTTGKPNGVTTTAKNVYSDDTDVPSLLMIPNGTTEQTLYVTVDYIVRTADPKLSTGYSEVEQIVTNAVSLKGLDVNKYYTLVMHLGLTSVKFSAVVTDWAVTDDATYNEGGIHDGDDPSTEVVWLPSNVINATTTTASAAGTSSNVNTAAKTTTYQITLSGLAEEQKIKADESAANITAVVIGSKDITSEKTLESTDLTAGAATVTVTLAPNTKVSAVSNLLTITQKASNNTLLSTTSVNIVQSPFDIVLAETTAGKVVSVKDGDDQNIDITNAAYTVTVLDSEGVTVNSSNYTKAAEGTITMNTTGTYTVIVEYDEDDDSTTDMTKTIKIKQ